MRLWVGTASLLATLACSGKPARSPTVAPTAPAASPAAAPPPITATPVPAGPATAPAPAPSNAQGVKVTLADVGLESGSLDRTTDPCVDFYQFACGGWLAQNQVPADRAGYGRGSEVDDRNKVAIKTLLEDAAKGIGADPGTKKLGDFYASCMDEAGIERAGIAPFKPLLDKLGKIKDARSWASAITDLHKMGVEVVFGEVTLADLKDSTTNVTYLDSSGLGLPDRDYYLKPDLADKVAAYRTEVGDLLRAAGLPGKADDIVAIEAELAKLTKTGVERRDPRAMYNATDAKALAKQVKSVDWKVYWKALGFEPSKKLVVTTPAYFAALDKLRAKFTGPQWAAYFQYHLLQTYAFAMGKDLDETAFGLDRILSGVEKQKDRSRRCIEATQDALGELLGQQYAAKYFPGSSKQTATVLVDALARVMADEIARLDWMTDATKQTALAKLGKLVHMIGFPDTWKTYSFDVKREDFAGNWARATAFEVHRVLARAGKPVDRGEWQMNTYQVDAYYDPSVNAMALPAGILQPPFFGQDRAVAVNLGGIGMVIGHELTHGFDDQGAQFDGDGNLKNWWGKDDAARFADKGTCVADQYSGFEAMPKGFVNGRLTLGEDIADMGGVKMAFRAYRALRTDAPKVYVADGFSEDQQFFIAVAQSWCSKDRPAEVQRRLISDVHAPPKFRVYGALRNLPEFSEAFSCAAGTPMHPAKTCTVW